MLENLGNDRLKNKTKRNKAELPLSLLMHPGGGDGRKLSQKAHCYLGPVTWTKCRKKYVLPGRILSVY